MAGFILGQKDIQKQQFDEAGVRIPVTYIKTTPCYIIDIKTPEKNGYAAVLLGGQSVKTNKKTIAGQLKKAGVKAPLRFLKEIRFAKNQEFIEKAGKSGLKIGDKEFFVGDEIKPAAIFQKGAYVKVTSVSKGKGFQGVVKRHGFAGGPRTHGQSDRERAPGSIGQTTTPGRVYKGKRMAGRMGGVLTSIKNLKVIEATDTALIVKGLIPGAKGSLVTVIE